MLSEEPGHDRSRRATADDDGIGFARRAHSSAVVHIVIRSSTLRFLGGGRCQPPQDRLKNAPVTEVFGIYWAVDASDRVELDQIAIRSRCLDMDPLPWRDLL